MNKAKILQNVLMKATILVVCLQFGSGIMNAQNAIADRGTVSLVQNITTNVFLEKLIDQIEIQEVTRLDAIRMIAKKAGMSLSYDAELQSLNEIISVDVSGMKVQDALWAVLDNSGMRYAVSRNGQLALFPSEIERPEQVVRNGTLSGKVTDSRNGDALIGASVYIESLSRGTLTDDEGMYQIPNIAPGAYQVVVTYIGYRRNQQSVEVRAGEEITLDFNMVPTSSTLQELEIVSTGYQDIPLERAAGSFVQINQARIEESGANHNVISRLDGNVPGLIFQRDRENRPINQEDNRITIRGISTINSANEPLIVVDGFPYDGDIRNINPDHVESITILKDASAASIWGAKAGNGVIVITTKRSDFNRKTNVSFSSSTTIGEKPDPFFRPEMTMDDYLFAAEEFFNHGYNQFPNITATTIIPPHIQIFMDRRDGKITDEVATARLNELKQHDVRDDYKKYYYRNSLNRQLSLNINGGTQNQHYSFAFGLDDNDHNIVANSYRRYTFDVNNTWRFFEDRLTFRGGFNFVRSQTELGNERGTPEFGIIELEDQGVFPYTRLADDKGNPLPVYLFNNAAIYNAMDNGFMDWRYFPINEIGLSPRITDMTDYRLSTNVSYRILDGLQLQGFYQYWNSYSESNKLSPMESYLVRNMVNLYTQVDASGNLSHPVPKGGILDMRNQKSDAHNFRTQINYNKNIAEDHSIVALAGYEIRDQQSDSRSHRYYGYNDNLAQFRQVDHVSSFRNSLTGSQNLIISPNVALSGNINRFISQYGNASYTYLNRYTLTASFRRDASNIFGVDTNNRVKPLWSLGFAWTISDEDFFRSDLVQYLKLRSSYGYNGNVNNNISALLTAAHQPASGNLLGFQIPYVQLTNPPNPFLRWEKIRIVNTGLDFALLNDRVSGSFEYFLKYGLDLIGGESFPPSTGVRNFSGNFASTRSHGIDLTIRSINSRGKLRWDSEFIFSFLNDKVTKVGTTPIRSSALAYGTGRSMAALPIRGNPLYAIYSFPFAGLDPENGDPLGYLNGEVSNNWSAIMSSYPGVNDLKYHGPGQPPVFGSIRNTISFNNITMSANVTYRFGYYFRNESIWYTNISSSFRPVSSDFSKRWNQPGDENHTNIPSFRPELTNAQNTNRMNFYANSSALVSRGDHIRLQEVMISYSMPNTQKYNLNRVKVYTHMNNVALLWKATKLTQDPDYRNYIQPIRNLTFGVRIDY